MIVSFDLDDTLFISPERTPAEKKLMFPFSLIYHDRLRLGTKKLFEYLYENDIRTWIYTTSFRSMFYIRSLFRHYGLHLDNIINGAVHQKEVQGSRADAMPSKYPSKYRISLHVDDDRSVESNGKLYGFNVYLITDNDSEWVENIIEKINHIRRSQSGN